MRDEIVVHSLVLGAALCDLGLDVHHENGRSVTKPRDASVFVQPFGKTFRARAAPTSLACCMPEPKAPAGSGCWGSRITNSTSSSGLETQTARPGNKPARRPRRLGPRV